jgi:peptide/nickel transport system permease protein
MLGDRATPESLARLTKELGYDRPYIVQYLDFLWGLLQGDMGVSIFDNRPVTEILLTGLKVTLRIGTLSLLLSMILGVSVGIFAAINRGKFADRLMMFLAMLGISLPVFWIAMVMQIYLGLKLRWFPISGMKDAAWWVMPVIALGTRYAATTARMVRTTMLDVLFQDYIRTAKAKGVSNFVVVMKHAFKNASIPIVTLTGLQLKFILSGTLVTETVFSLPGLGKIAVDAVLSRNIPVIQGTVIYGAILFVFINLIVDLLYGVLDPRIRISEAAI